MADPTILPAAQRHTDSGMLSLVNDRPGWFLAVELKGSCWQATHFEHNPARFPQVPQHIRAVVEDEIRGNSPAFRLEHHWPVGCCDHA